ncbi:proline iminopeptidase [Allochromatium warmingii]|uniref:Proline iminopeptidase n=1 Tax=Allochromatium warmingii TaxID=61595 RepID=A0A1H3EP57_ALLWA|nr:prolyl aminopeptidase [Allochromatium warmingii]SDX80410.1 proline iminopeptidase [Allochromatium warmingii]
MSIATNDLYPITEPFAVHEVTVDHGHRLYVEECGQPDGFPAIFLHGGPGAGCEPTQRGFFDPDRYRAIFFDQRGCGRSTPHASLVANTTWDLIADLEVIRHQLGIERWLVFGGSWGSTLALAYAETYPERVTALVVRGIFLCRPEELHWFYQEGTNWVFPDLWTEFITPIPESERGDLLTAYHRRLIGENSAAQLEAARAWSIWEGRTATLLANPRVQAHFSDSHVALSLARIESHYFVNQAFLAPNQLLRDASRLANIPGVIIQGRYDLICPMRSAWDLHQAWPTAELQIIPDAGHSAFEPGIRRALVAATDRFAQEFTHK